MNNNMPRTPFSTQLSGSAKETERRLKHIFSGPKKRPPVLFLALVFAACLLCGNLVSCQVAEVEENAPSDTSRPDTSQAEPDASIETEQNTPEVPDPVSPPAVDPDASARAAYVQVLEDLLYRSTLPDSTQPVPGFEDMSDNTFALADVDGDGQEELVFLTRPNVHAGYQGYVLGYDQDSDSVQIQFKGYPSFTFYHNGALAENDSHGSLWTGQLWPHSLYRYLPETDSYELAGHVDAWEKAVSDLNPDSLPPFPAEKDISGAGILYYITPAEDMGPSFTGYSTEAVDQSVYLEWLEPILEGSQPLDLEYFPLTEENIRAITQTA